MYKWIKSTDYSRFEIADWICRITLNRPEKRNAMSLQLLRELHDALLEADDRKDVRCVVLAGEGKDFCSGYDLSSVDAYRPKAAIEADAKAATDGIDRSLYRGVETFDDDTWLLERMEDMKRILFDMHKPVIARVQGNCLAGGTDIALVCDMVICTHDAKFGFPAARAQGSAPNHMWLYHAGPQWAKRLLMTGDSIVGRDAMKIGLVMKSVTAAKLDAEVDALARRLSNVHADLLAAHKRIVNIGLELMGARTLQRMAGEADARAHMSPYREVFRENFQRLGLKEALRQRDAPFGDGIAHFDDET